LAQVWATRIFEIRNSTSNTTDFDLVAPFAISAFGNMENQSYPINAGSYQVPPKQRNRKGKSKQGQKSGSGTEVAALQDAGSNCAADTGVISAISALQEFVQSSKTYRMSGTSVLLWHYEERTVPGQRAGTQCSEFRATVGFVLEGVPLHAQGYWHSSKKQAQRDAAECALVLFVGKWGEQLLREEQISSNSGTSLAQNGQSNDGAIAGDPDVLRDLQEFCEQYPPCGQLLPEIWTSWDEDVSCWKGCVKISLCGTEHTFAGVPCEDEQKARLDVARRVLWYMQCPGYADAYEVDMKALAARSEESAPPACWLGGPDRSLEQIAVN